MLTPEQRQKVVDEIVKSGNMFIDSGSWNEAKGNVSSATKILDAVVEKHGPAEAYVIIGMVTEALAEANSIFWNSVRWISFFADIRSTFCERASSNWARRRLVLEA